jgi:hypothetical protein
MSVSVLGPLLVPAWLWVMTAFVAPVINPGPGMFSTDTDTQIG